MDPEGILSHSTKLVTKTDLIDPRFGEIQVINRSLESEWNSRLVRDTEQGLCSSGVTRVAGQDDIQGTHGTSTSLVELS